MEDWHKCSRWMKFRMRCPFAGLPQHDGAGDREPEDNNLPWYVPAVAKATKKSRKALEAAEPTVVRKPVTSDREWDIPPVGPVPVPIAPRPPIPRWVPARVPVYEPGRVPSRVPAGEPMEAAKAIRDARGRVPARWNPTEEQVRRLLPGAVDPRTLRGRDPRERLANARSAVAEIGASQAANDVRRVGEVSQVSNRRRFISAGVAGAAVIGAGVVASRKSGGPRGRGMQFDQRRRMPFLFQQAISRRMAQLTSNQVRSRRQALADQQPKRGNL